MLGRGGFACVYRAHSLITGQEVAIKMVCFNLKFIHNAVEYINTLSNHYSMSEMFWNMLKCFNILQIDKNLMQTEGMVARVRKEVEIHSRLKHPSILEVNNYKIYLLFILFTLTWTKGALSQTVKIQGGNHNNW